MRLFRRIAFYAFLLLYVVLCPVTVFSTLGYVFIPGGQQQIVKTGLIYLATAPPGATVYVGNRRFTRQTPTILRELQPGTYDIRLAVKGHRPWTHRVPVEAEQATVLEHVLLLPRSLHPVQAALGPFENLLPVSDKVLLLQRGPLLRHVTVYDPRAEREWPLLAPGSPLEPARLIDASRVPDSDAVVLEVVFGGSERLLWADLSGREPHIEDLSSFLVRRPLWVTWDAEDKRHVFALQDKAIHRIDLAARTSYPAFVNRAVGMGVFRHALYVLREHGVLERMDPQGHSSEVLWRNLIPGPPPAADAAFRVQLLSDDTVLLWGRRGELLANHAPYQLVERGVRGVVHAPKQHRRALVWQRDRLGVLDFSGAVEGGSVEEMPPLRWAYKQGRDIRQAFWMYDGSHGLIRDDDQVLLLDLETYGKPEQQLLFRVKRHSAIAYSEEAGVLYYLDPSSGSLMACELLPKREILPFPDRREPPRRPTLEEP